jgi:hypothetical protein
MLEKNLDKRLIEPDFELTKPSPAKSTIMLINSLQATKKTTNRR